MWEDYVSAFNKVNKDVEGRSGMVRDLFMRDAVETLLMVVYNESRVVFSIREVVLSL